MIGYLANWVEILDNTWHMDIYLDTSVVSALFDGRNPERKAITEDFFRSIENHSVHVSELTLAEIENTSDATLRNQMQEKVKSLIVLPLADDVESLSNKYVEHGAISANYAEDTYHIAISVINHIPILLSWNFRHIVRRKTKDIVNLVNTMSGYPHLEIITPGEFL